MNVFIRIGAHTIICRSSITLYVYVTVMRSSSKLKNAILSVATTLYFYIKKKKNYT